MQDYPEQLLNLLIKSIEKISKQEVEMAFSGGLDSSVLAKLLVLARKKVTGYVAGIKDSKDILQARKAAEEIGIELVEIILTEKEVEEFLGNQAKIIEKIYKKIKNKEDYHSDSITPNAIPISYNFPLFFVAKNSKSKEVIVSQGPDEMFGGYHKHQESENPEEDMKRDLKLLEDVAIKQNQETAKFWGKEFIFPYLAEEIIEFSKNLPLELKKNKEILRKIAIKIGLSKELSSNKKRAAQYGSGIMDLMRNLAKKQGHHISWLVGKKLRS